MQHYAYSSFGKILKIVDGSGADITANPIVKTSYGFTNREHDSETGMMYYRARYMMPEIGRFIQEDPHPGRLTLPITLITAYVYAGNNPINNIDPDGKIFWTLFAIGAVIGFAQNFSAAYNAKDENGKKRGFTWDAVLSGALGAVTGGLQAGLGALSGPWLALAIPASAALAGLNNAGNQLIFKGKVDDWRGFQDALVGGAIGGAAGLGSYGLNATFTSKAIAQFSFLLSVPIGYKSNNGIPSNEDKVDCTSANAPSYCSEFNL